MKSDKALIFSLILTCFLCGCATSTKPMLGSWGQTIKDNSTWGSDDVESTVDALVGTGQNFHIYPINSENEWIDFQALLEDLKIKKISEKDLKIFAVMPSPHLSHSDSRWFGSSGPPTNSCSGHDLSKRDCDRSYMETWLNAWESAAMELSELSIPYENLTGFVINDFMNYVESADLPSEVYGDRLKKSDIDRLHAAARLHNCEFEFWPAIHYMNIGRFIADGHVLGINYGAGLSSLDRMSVKLIVNIPYQPAWGILRFYHTATGKEQDINKSVLVNGSSLSLDTSESLSGDEYTQAFAKLIELDRGTNTIEFALSASPSTPGVTHTSSGGTNKFWYIWDVRVETVTPPPSMSNRMIDHWRNNLLGGSRVPVSGTEYAVNTDPDDYTPVNGGADHSGGTKIYNSDYRAFGSSAGLPDNSTDGFIARRLVAAPSDTYSIKDAVDGFIPYLGRTEEFGSDDAYIVERPDPSVDEPYRALLASTSGILGDTKLMAIHTAFSGSGSYKVKPEILMKRTSIASEEADATGIYLFPLGLYFMSPPDKKGIFGESTFASSPCLTSEPDAQFMAQWPQGQPPLPGWYQRWVYPSTFAGRRNLRVETGDNRGVDVSRSGNLYKYIYSTTPAGTTDHYNSDIYLDDTSVRKVPTAPGYISSNTRSPLSLKMYSNGVANVNTCVYFKVQDDAGNYVDKSDFTFESGLDLPDGARTLEIYNLHKRFFQSFH